MTDEERINYITLKQGFLKKNSEETYLDALSFLVNEAKMDEELALALLSDLYFATSEEFGE